MWALDLGTTNTALAYWDEDRQRPVLLELPDICRLPEEERTPEPLEAAHLVPSAVEAFDRLTLWSYIGTWPLVQRSVFIGKQAFIGRTAWERFREEPRPSFVSGFKPHLAVSPLRTLARSGGHALSARDVARLFLRELFSEATETSGRRIRDLVVTTPVDAYEGYRAEVASLLRELGVRNVRFVDEPVAAAMGYDIAPGRDRNALVVDFGGGTLDVAFVTLGAKEMSAGRGHVLGKSGRNVGGQLVDRWIVEDICRRLDYRVDPDRLDDPKEEWSRQILAEACRAKERLFFEEQVTIVALPPDELQRFDERMRGGRSVLTYSRDDLVALLEERGLYRGLEEAIDDCLDQARSDGDEPSEIDDVLMVGGSTLLPNVYSLVEARFGREAVRAWHPFEAVVQGATRFAAGQVQTSDFIVHDYAFVTYDLDTHQKQYAIVVPSGTRFPTVPDYWKRQLVPTCSLGEPETMFKLVICELGRPREGDRRFTWDQHGKLHVLTAEGADDRQLVVVPLNESNPTLGYLRPPHPPEDKKPRLEISFGVNADRWLCASVFDIKTRRYMMREEPVVRLL